MLWDEPKIFFLERRYFFSIILSEFLKNRVALHRDLRLGYGNAERQVFLNVLMTVPFGILWPVVRRGKAGVFRTVGAAFLLSLCIELVQPLLPTARMSDITDLICNTAGGLIGYGLYRPWKKALGCWM